jgi:hypothetical protein
MRRALANLLIVMWLVSGFAPLLQAQTGVPACCRADGKHHCALHSSGDGFHPTPCSSSHHLPASITSSSTALGAQARFALLESRWNKLLTHRSPDIFRFQSGDLQKRGPPLG